MTKDWPAGKTPVNNKAAAGTTVGKAIAGGIQKGAKVGKAMAGGIKKGAKYIPPVAIYNVKQKRRQRRRKHETELAEERKTFSPIKKNAVHAVK